MPLSDSRLVCKRILIIDLPGMIWDLRNLNVGDLKSAEKAFKRAIDVNPKDPYAYNNLGRVYVREKKYQEADQLYRSQIEVNANDKYAHHNLGISLRDEGKYGEALQEFNKAQAITPANPTLHINIGETYLRMERDQEAMGEFEKAVELSPTPSVWNNVACMLARRGKNLDRAEKLAECAIQSQPRDCAQRTSLTPHAWSLH